MHEEKTLELTQTMTGSLPCGHSPSIAQASGSFDSHQQPSGGTGTSIVSSDSTDLRHQKINNLSKHLFQNSSNMFSENVGPTDHFLEHFGTKKTVAVPLCFRTRWHCVPQWPPRPPAGWPGRNPLAAPGQKNPGLEDAGKLSQKNDQTTCKNPQNSSKRA